MWNVKLKSHNEPLAEAAYDVAWKHTMEYAAFQDSNNATLQCPRMQKRMGESLENLYAVMVMLLLETNWAGHEGKGPHGRRRER